MSPTERLSYLYSLREHLSFSKLFNVRAVVVNIGRLKVNDRLLTFLAAGLLSLNSSLLLSEDETIVTESLVYF